MTPIKIDDKIKKCCPNIQLGCIECDVKIQQDNPNLWEEIDQVTRNIRSGLRLEHISKHSVIQHSRKAYKACGKDPARYRLSAEALFRRVVKGEELYRINNVVDVVNLISLSTGYSIGGYDAEKINGPVEFGIGGKEPYRGIGRGELNIEYLPVFRDENGPFGSPTSDSERTSVTLSTQRFLMIIIDFSGDEEFAIAMDAGKNLLQKYCYAENIEGKIVH